LFANDLIDGVPGRLGPVTVVMGAMPMGVGGTGIEWWPSAGVLPASHCESRDPWFLSPGRGPVVMADAAAERCASWSRMMYATCSSGVRDRRSRMSWDERTCRCRTVSIWV